MPANRPLALVPPDRPDEHPNDKLLRLVEGLNDRYALTTVGSTAMVLEEIPPTHPAAAQLGSYRLLALDAFKMLFRPFRVWDGYKMVSHAEAWLGHPARRKFDALVFAPGPNGTVLDTPECYNTWRGFAVAPDPDPAPETRCARFLDHVLRNLCSGDHDLRDWVLGWFAQMLQRPQEKPGVSLAFRGAQGTGKNTIYDALELILGPHAWLVKTMERVTGRFNSSFASLLLLALDEATWGGDKAAEGVLKDLVTGKQHTVEFKGREAIRVQNHTRLLVFSNNEWILPAGKEERRFAVIDVAKSAMQDGAYFAAIAEELRTGGAAALLAYLLAYPLDDINLRQIPSTEALHKQQILGLSGEEQWWLGVLRRGAMPRDDLGADLTGWARVPTHALYDDYVEHSKTMGYQRRVSDTALGIYLHKAAPGIERKRLPSVATAGGKTKRPWGYAVPPLAVCRAAFAEEFGRHRQLANSWDDPDATWAVDDEPHRSEARAA